MGRPKRKLAPVRGYKPSGEPMGYTPVVRSRKAPRAYWCRNPYPVGFGETKKKKQER